MAFCGVVGMIDDSAVFAALEAKASELQDRLLARIMADLSGDVLQARSGALKASIVSDLTVDAGALAVTLASQGVPYAAIQEYGGTTAPHEIVPVKAQALAFAGAGGQTFSRRVRHPGSVIPARAYLGGALDALRDDIAGGLKEAVLDALGAS